MTDRNPLYNRNRNKSSNDEGFRNSAQDQSFSSRRSGGRAAQRANSRITERTSGRAAERAGIGGYASDRTASRTSDRVAEPASGRTYDAAERTNGRARNHVADRNERYNRDRASQSSRRDKYTSDTDRSNRSRAGNSDRSVRENRTKQLDQTSRQNRRGNDFQNRPRHASSIDAMQRRRGSTSTRESYGHARDYAQEGSYTREGRYIPDEPEYSGYDERRQERGYERRQARHQQERQRSYRSGQAYDDYYDDGYEDTFSEESSYRGRHSESERHRRDESDRRGRHSEPNIYVRSGYGRGLFNDRIPLPFGSGGYGGNHAMGGGSFLSSLPLPVLYAIPVIVLILIILLFVFIISSVQSCTAPQQEEQEQVEVTPPMNISYQSSVTGLDAIADPGATVTGFTLANEGQNYMPSLSEEGQNIVQSALAPFTENEYDVGFVMLDLQTGSGYVYNPDLEVYGASSFKGPVLIYGCQEALEPGILSIDTVNESASGAIIDSNNRSYYTMRALFEEYSDISLTSWLANMNIDSDVESDTSFPHYSARESAKLWLNAYQYFTSSDSNPDIVSWAQDLFSQTTVSMLRAGVDPTFALVTDGGEVLISQPGQSAQSGDTSGSGDGSSDSSADQSGDGSSAQDSQSSDQGSDQTSESGDQGTDQSSDQGSDQSSDQSADQNTDQSSDSGLTAADMAPATSNVVVYDKAGWLNGETDDGLCDAGIVIEGDKAYLISVMSGAPDSDTNRQNLANLVAALWSQRASLAPSQGYVLVDPAPADQSSDSGDTSSGESA